VNLLGSQDYKMGSRVRNRVQEGEAMQAQGLEIQASACAGSQTLIVAGEVDMATSPSLEDAVGRACSGDPAKLVLDLTRVTFIDSTGLNAILSARTLCVQRTFGFEVVIATPQVKRLFEICGLRNAPFLTLVDASAAAGCRRARDRDRRLQAASRRPLAEPVGAGGEPATEPTGASDEPAAERSALAVSRSAYAGVLAIRAQPPPRGASAPRRVEPSRAGRASSRSPSVSI
jgi:anti-sigma B factor antagonist